MPKENKHNYDSISDPSPLAYIKQGATLRESNAMVVPQSPQDLARCLMHYLYFMEKRRDYSGSKRPYFIPLTFESFRLFAGVTPEEYDSIASTPDGARVHQILSDCIKTQWIEGSALGVYNSKCSQLYLDLTAQGDASPSAQLEQITGIQVL